MSLADAASHSGVPAEQIQTLAERLADAQRPVVYGRVGTTLQAFGTLTSFLVEVLNLQLGALDHEGGALFGEQPFTQAARPTKTGIEHGRWHSRVSGMLEVGG